MWYKIIPNDTLFFRDGKPFSMGMETWASSIFPPNPSTLYGAIRTWLIFEKGNLKAFKEGKLKEELGTPDEKGTLKIKGPFLFKKEALFPVPKDLLKEKGKTDNELFRLNLVKPEIFISDYPENKHILVNKSNRKLEEVEGFITSIYLEDYLSGKDKLRLTKKEEIYIEEPKIGIAREKITKTTKEGYLYQISMIRLKEDVSMVVKIEGVKDIPESGIIQLGGDGRTAKIEKIEDNIFQNVENINLKFENKKFKIYLATHAIFENGYLPKWINKDWEGEYNGIKLRLICCVIGRYRLIGGWDLAKNEPKGMHRAVPAGSVYYFEILDNSSAESIKNVFHFKNISEINPEEGYGLSFIGKIKE